MATATRVKTCPICQDELKDPRLLPCIHSFCLECLERHWRDKEPGDDVPCPVCRHEFQIPKTGVAGLTVRTHNIEPAPSSMCEVCSSEQCIVSATVFCVNCGQKLCERCSLPHLKMRSGPHDVKGLDEVSPNPPIGRTYCNKHNEQLSIYCFKCQIYVCSTCRLESHKGHKCDRTDVVVPTCSRSIDDGVEQVTSRIESFRCAASQVKAESDKSLRSVQAIEREIKKRGEEVKESFAHLIDRQVGDLLDKLQFIKSAAEKEVQLKADAVQLALTELESFRTSSLELKSRGSPSDITQAVSDVLATANTLLQKHAVPGDYHAPTYTFTPVNFDLEQNFIGHVVEVAGRGMSICFNTYLELLSFCSSNATLCYRLIMTLFLLVSLSRDSCCLISKALINSNASSTTGAPDKCMVEKLAIFDK